MLRVRCRTAMAKVPPPAMSPDVEEEILTWWADRTLASREAVRSARPRNWPVLLATALVTAGILLSGYALLSPAMESSSSADPPLMVGRAAEDAALEPTAAPGAPALARSVPMAVDIPSIGVRSGELVRLRLAKDGGVQAPPLTQVHRAGWYADGPTPGETGPAVIVGHLDLAKVREGDKIRIPRKDGTVAVFSAESVQRIRKKNYPHRRVHGDLDYPGLRLISGGGRDSVIVYARMTGVR